MLSVEDPAKPRWWRLVRSGFVGGLAAFGLLSSISLAYAQTPAPEQDQLFQKMLRNPKNIEITFAYVKVATANGDYEAAIGALERILFYQPGLARVKYNWARCIFVWAPMKWPGDIFAKPWPVPISIRSRRTVSRHRFPTPKSSSSRIVFPVS